MATVPRDATSPLPTFSSAAPESGDFEQRWAAWQAKGAERDRVQRRRMAMGAPILIILAGIVFALLVA